MNWRPGYNPFILNSENHQWSLCFFKTRLLKEEQLRWGVKMLKKKAENKTEWGKQSLYQMLIIW